MPTSPAVRAGASIITITGVNTNAGTAGKLPAAMDVAHFAHFDLYDPQCQNYLMQLTDQIHLYQSVTSVGMFAAGHTYPLRHDDGTVESVKVHPDHADVRIARSKSGSSQPMMEINGAIDDTTTPDILDKVRKSFAQQELACDSIVVAAGMKARTDEALDFATAAPEFHLIGDCRRPASIQQANRDALGVACVL